MADFSYNLEEATVKLPQAIEAMNDLVKNLNDYVNSIEEIAKESGVPKLQADVEQYSITLKSFIKTLEKMRGAEGDNASGTGSLYGLLHFAKTSLAAVGG